MGWNAGRVFASVAAPVLLLLTIVLLAGQRASGEDIFASTEDIKFLYRGEETLIASLKSYIESERARLAILDRLVLEVEETRTSRGSGAFTDHPVNVFHLIHRFITTWRQSILGYVADFRAYEAFTGVYNSLQKFLPLDRDYDGARSALLRLQRTYHLPTADVINGTVLGQKAMPLSQQKAYDIALYALHRGFSDAALDWLTHVQHHPIPPLILPQYIYYEIGRVLAHKRQLLESVEYIKKALELDPQNEVFLSNVVPAVTAELQNTHYIDVEDYHSLCRRASLTVENSPDKRLRCNYRYGSSSPFSRIKVEHLHIAPDVMVFHDFVTNVESENLRKMAANKIERATTGLAEDIRASEIRVGKVAWFYDNEGEPLVGRISKRISAATGLEVNDHSAEALQMSNYGIGGHYFPHYDHDETRYTRRDVTDEVKRAGDRIATFMIYLNDVSAGGATVFPLINLTARPIPNAAIFWYNYNVSGFPDDNTLHAACPVIIGEKWVANKWIREFGQEFKRPCDIGSSVTS